MDTVQQTLHKNTAAKRFNYGAIQPQRSLPTCDTIHSLMPVVVLYTQKTQPSSLVAYMSTDISSDGSTVYKEGLSFLSVSEDCFMIQHEVIHVIYRKLLYSQQHRSILHKAQTIIGHQITLTF